jgi:hypothetical protein
MVRNDVSLITELDRGDQVVLDGRRETFTVVSYTYGPGGNELAVKAVDGKLNEYELRPINNEFIDVRGDDAPAIGVIDGSRPRDFEHVGHDMEPIERLHRQVWGDA